MKRIFASLLILACLSSVTFGAIPAGAVWEMRTTGAQASGGGFCWTSLVNATYKWTASASGTNEYYCEIAAGGDPSLVGSGSVTCDGNYNLSTAGAVGSLAAGQHAFGDNDKLGYTTPYVRLANGLDPDAMIARGQPGYVSYGAGGTDYSQQADAQMSATDIRITRGDNKQVYRTGATKWAQDYDNNSLHITAGAGFTPGWYHIQSVDPNNDALLDTSPGAAGTNGGTGAVGGAFLIGGAADDDYMEAWVPGNRAYIRSGAYTLGEAMYTSENSTVTAHFIVSGYSSSRGELPIGTSRPILACGSNSFGWGGSYFYCENIEATGTGAKVFTCSGSRSVVFNCRATNTAAGGVDAFLIAGTGVTLIACEGQTASAGTGAAFHMSVAVCDACYAHDSPRGFYVDDDFSAVLNSIADTCVTGIYDDSVDGMNPNLYAGNTIYNCTNGIYFSGARVGLVVNNAISECTNGINRNGAGTVDGNLHSLYNVMNNTTDFTDAVSHISNIFGDPGLNAPATGDFSIDSSDTNVYEQGVDVGYFTTAITYDE